MITLTREQLIVMNPCGDQVKLFGKCKSMNAEQAFKAGASISDLCWVAQKLGHANLLVKFALKCAQSVAYLNTDPSVKAALDAAQARLDNPCKETQDAANAAAAAAAANAAAAAAYAAAYAADAAYAAAAAAYAAAAANEKEKQKAWFIEIFS